MADPAAPTSTLHGRPDEYMCEAELDAALTAAGFGPQHYYEANKYYL